MLELAKVCSKSPGLKWPHREGVRSGEGHSGAVTLIPDRTQKLHQGLSLNSHGPRPGAATLQLPMPLSEGPGHSLPVKTRNHLPQIPFPLTLPFRRTQSEFNSGFFP